MFSYEVIQNFNDLEMIIYQYINEHKQEIKYMTIRELAEAAHVSTSAIVRFCKKNGCDGYSEFRTKFKMYLSEERKRQPKNGIDEITNFFQNVSNPEFEKRLSAAAAAMSFAKQLVFIGIGTSGCLAKYGARYFSNLDKFSMHIEDPYFPVGKEMENTVVIALSVSGETPETVNLAEKLKFHGCRLVSITNKSDCSLARMSDYNISYYVTESLSHDEYNITTQVPVIYLLETLGKMIS